MRTVISVPLLWLLCLLSVLLHELGHAVGHRIAGNRGPWRIYVGSGPRFFDRGRFSFHLLPVGGYYVPEDAVDSKKAAILMLAGGPLLSLLLTVLFGVLRFLVFPSAAPEGALLDPQYLCAFLFLGNLFQFLFTALPLRYRIVCRGHDSDGRQILSLLRQGKDGAEKAAGKASGESEESPKEPAPERPRFGPN